MPMRSMNKTIIRISALLICLFLLIPDALALSLSDGLTIAVRSTVTTYLNPLTPSEREMQSLTALIYEPLYTMNDKLEPVPLLAQKTDISNDGKVWQITLRQGVTFHDGSPLTARDVVATINEILRLAEMGLGQYRSLQYMISSASANDDRVVIINAARPCYGMYYALTFPVLRESQVQLERPSGTGPYRVVSFNPGQELLLSANEEWWDGVPRYRELNFNFYATNRELLSAYEYKQADAIITRSATAAQYQGGRTSLNVSYRTQQLETLMINHSSFPLEDTEIRRAIRYAIDVDNIAANVYTDMVRRTDTPLIPDTWTYLTGSDYGYDPEKAKEILAAKGWSDTDNDGVLDMIKDGRKRNLQLRIYVYEEQDNSVRILAANMISDYLKAVGINAPVTTMNFTEAQTKLSKRSFDLCLAAFQMDTVPDPGFLLMIGNTANYMGYRSKEMDNFFKNLRKALTKEEYQKNLFDIQRLFEQDCPFICLYYRTGAILTRKLFTNAVDVREPEVLRGIEYAEP